MKIFGNVFKSSPLRNRIVLQLTLGFAIIYIVIVYLISVKAQENAKNSAMQLSRSESLRFANSMRSVLSVDFGTEKTAAALLSNMNEYGEQKDQFLTRQIDRVVRSQKRYFGMDIIFKSDFWNKDPSLKGQYLKFTIKKGEDNKVDMNKSDFHTTDTMLLASSNKGLIYLEEPFHWAGAPENYTASLLHPINSFPNNVGCMRLYVSLQELNLMVANTKGENLYAYLVSSNGIMASHSDSLKIGSTFYDNFPNTKNDTTIAKIFTSKQGGIFSFEHEINGEKCFLSFAQFRVGNTRDQWLGGVAMPYSKITEASNQIVYSAILYGLIGMIFIVIVAWYLSTVIVRPIIHVTEFAQRIGDGDVSEKIDLSSYKKRDELSIMMIAMNNTIYKISSFVEDIRTESERLKEEATGLLNESNSLSDSSTEMAANAEEVSSVIEEMSSIISSSKENAELTAKKSQVALQEIISGNESSQKVVDAMQEINKRIVVISEIAIQTNILSLNAAVEAARAGEAGKGFAVVASEVKKLAEKSREAAQLIEDLVGSTLIESLHTGEQLSVLVKDMEVTASLMEEISVSSAEQSQGVDQIAVSLTDLNQISQKNAGMSDLLKERASVLSNHSENLNRLVESFKTSV